MGSIPPGVITAPLAVRLNPKSLQSDESERVRLTIVGHEQVRRHAPVPDGGLQVGPRERVVIDRLHVAQDDMPFGGIGPSGMGHYHGHEGFLTFSKAKGVFIKQRFNAAKMIYPPYGKAIQKLVYKFFVR